jgi:hypothetical protein
LETIMSDQALKANELYAKTYDPKGGRGLGVKMQAGPSV